MTQMNQIRGQVTLLILGQGRKFGLNLLKRHGGYTTFLKRQIKRGDVLEKQKVESRNRTAGAIVSWSAGTRPRLFVG